MAPRRSSNLLHARLSTLLDAVPAAQTGDETSVHQARVASRRLREVLPVAGAAADGADLKRARKQVRRVTRALGPARETDVALGNLSEFAERGVASARALARVRRNLERQRQQQRAALLDALSPVRLDKLKRRVEELRAQAADPAALPTAMAEAGRRVARRAVRLSAAIEWAGAVYLADRLHAVRVAAKKLRYALEIDRELHRSRATARIQQLKSLQDLLGRLHDLEVLIDRTRASQADAAAADRRTSVELDRLVRALEDECRQLHATYMARRPSILKLCNALAAAGDGPHRPSEAA
jgi:CHAD domain-containing protein